MPACEGERHYQQNPSKKEEKKDASDFWYGITYLRKLCQCMNSRAGCIIANARAW